MKIRKTYKLLVVRAAFSGVWFRSRASTDEKAVVTASVKVIIYT